MVLCWRGSSRGCDCSGLLQRLSVPCPVLGMYIQPMVPALGATSLERVMCYWDHLDCKHDWTLWGPLFKRLRSWQTDSEIYSSHSHSRPASHVCSLAFRLVTTNLEGSAPPSVSFCHPGTGTVSNFTERLPRLWTNILPMVSKAESKTVIQPRASSLFHSLKHFARRLVWEDDGPGGMLRRWWLSWSLKQILIRNFTHIGTKEHSWKSLWNNCCCVLLLRPVRLCDPIDCSPPDSSFHGIVHARILEWVAISYFRSSGSRDQIHISCICRQILYYWI